MRLVFFFGTNDGLVQVKQLKSQSFDVYSSNRERSNCLKLVRIDIYAPNLHMLLHRKLPLCLELQICVLWISPSYKIGWFALVGEGENLGNFGANSIQWVKKQNETAQQFWKRWNVLVKKCLRNVWSFIELFEQPFAM